MGFCVKGELGRGFNAAWRTWGVKLIGFRVWKRSKGSLDVRDMGEKEAKRKFFICETIWKPLT